jgi:hypothetical protein
LVWAALVFTAFLYVPFLFNILSSPFLPAEDPSAVVALFERWQNFFEPFHWVILSGRDLPLLLFLLVFLWILEAGPRVPPLAYVCFSFLPVASLAYSVDRGAYLVGIALVLSWLLYRTAPAKSPFWISTLLGVLGSALTLGYAVHWNYSGFFHYVFGELPRYKMFTDKLPYPIHEPKFALALIALAFIPFRLLQRFLAFKLVQKGAFIPVLRAFLVQNAIGLALACVALACFRNVLERPDLDHLASNSLWTFLFLIWELSLSPKPPFQKGTTRPALAIVCILVLLMSGLGLYRVFRFDLMEKNFPFQRSDSTFLSQDRLETVAFLGSVLKKDEPFFAFTVDASWYYLLDRPCPTRYPCLWVAAPRTLQEDVIASLEAKRVRWVLYPSGEWVSNIDGIPDAERFPYVDRYLRDHFRFYKKAGGQGIWVRKTKA